MNHTTTNGAKRALIVSAALALIGVVSIASTQVTTRRGDPADPMSNQSFMGATGPWLAYNVNVRSAADDSLQAVRITEGPALVHAIIFSNAHATIFDGPGTTANGSVVAQGSPLARVASYTRGDQGRGDVTTDQVMLDVVATRSLYLAWNVNSSNAIVTVLFRPLAENAR